MTLFQILTRKLAIGKIKATRKLLDRLRRETGGKRHLKAVENAPKTLVASPGHSAPRSWPHWRCQFVSSTDTAANSRATGASRRRHERLLRRGALQSGQRLCPRRQTRPGHSELFQRAQLLAPNDADIAANLHFVRAKAGLPDAAESWLTPQLDLRPLRTRWLGWEALA